jgi:hypothetical protein
MRRLRTGSRGLSSCGYSIALCLIHEKQGDILIMRCPFFPSGVRTEGDCLGRLPCDYIAAILNMEISAILLRISINKILRNAHSLVRQFITWNTTKPRKGQIENC